MTIKTQLLNTVDWRKYLIPNGSKRIETFLEHNGDDVFNQISLNVFKAIGYNHPKLVMIVHPNAGNAIVIHDYEYEEFLKVATDWFVKKEKYEMCSKITQHISLLKNKKIEVVSKKTTKSLI